jgi:hypothetical protein
MFLLFISFWAIIFIGAIIGGVYWYLNYGKTPKSVELDKSNVVPYFTTNHSIMLPWNDLQLFTNSWRDDGGNGEFNPTNDLPQSMKPLPLSSLLDIYTSIDDDNVDPENIIQDNLVYITIGDQIPIVWNLTVEFDDLKKSVSLMKDGSDLLVLEFSYKHTGGFYEIRANLSSSTSNTVEDFFKNHLNKWELIEENIFIEMKRERVAVGSMGCSHFALIYDYETDPDYFRVDESNSFKVFNIQTQNDTFYFDKTFFVSS